MRVRTSLSTLLPLVGAALMLASQAGAVTIDWVPVGNPGNAPDAAANCLVAGGSCGSVSYGYSISKYEVTNGQYSEFLNAKAASDPLGLYNASMGADTTWGGITQGGISGSFTYSVKPGFTTRPVTYLSFYDVARFTNWLNNGQGGASTETGAYALLGGTATPSNPTFTRNALATIFVPNENEWYKAAYNSPGGVYFDYPTGTNTAIGCVSPAGDTGNSANCYPQPAAPTNVGAYGLSDSPYGTFDQGGNVLEWTESTTGFTTRILRGGEVNNLPIGLHKGSSSTSQFGATEFPRWGFRVATLVTAPEPGTGLLVMMGLLGLAAARRRRV